MEENGNGDNDDDYDAGVCRVIMTTHVVVGGRIPNGIDEVVAR